MPMISLDNFPSTQPGEEILVKGRRPHATLAQDLHGTGSLGSAEGEWLNPLAYGAASADR